MNENTNKEAKKATRTRKKTSIFKLLKKAPAKIKIVLCVMLILVLGLGTLEILRIVKPASGADIDTKVTDLGFKNIGKLATQAAYYTEIVSDESYRKFFGTDFNVPGTKSSFIISIDGIMTAGIDFEKIAYTIDYDNKIIEIKLPEVELLSNELDLASQKTWDEKNNVFNPKSVSVVNEALIEIKQTAEEKWVSRGLLANAEENAKSLIEGQCKAQLPEYKVVFR